MGHTDMGEGGDHLKFEEEDATAKDEDDIVAR
jgi:hypothetical protein